MDEEGGKEGHVHALGSGARLRPIRPTSINQSAGPFTGEAYQNPFFMPYETAVRQWTQCVPAEEGAGSSRRKVQQDGGVEIASARRKPRREI